jgi:hypothetical protein
MRAITKVLDIIATGGLFLLLAWAHHLLFEVKDNRFLAMFLVLVSLAEVLMFRLFLLFYKASKNKQ